VLGYDLSHLAMVNAADFANLPVCVILVGVATGRVPQPSATMRLLCVLIPLGTLVGALTTGHSLLEPRWGCVAVGTSLGSALIWSDVGSRTLCRLSTFGSISYAFYLFHEPILEFGRFLIPTHAIIAVGLFFVMAILVSWLLEMRLQPIFRRRPLATSAS
jgi:peptidoglycan/LPS O-acetylase OafA/YrhL